MIKATALLAAIAALTAALTPSFALAAKPGAIAAAIESAAEAAVVSGQAPGLQIAVFKDDQPLLVRGFGSANLELGAPIGNASVFRVGSVTKQFTAAVLLQMRDEGLLSLEDRLSKYYADFPHSQEITLRQMLNHTSGIHNYTEEEGFFQRGDAMVRHSTREMVDFFITMPVTQDFAPGASWRYSNTAYFMLGGVIEQVENQALDQVFEKRIFAPLGMNCSAVDQEAHIAAGRVSGYAIVKPGDFRNAGFISMTVPGAAGNMRSTASDLAVWLQALFAGKVLKPASLSDMLAPGALNDGRNSKVAFPAEMSSAEGYGLGLVSSQLQGHRRVGHDGNINGFSASVAVFPQDHITVVILSNGMGDHIGVGALAERIQAIALGLQPGK